MGSFYEGSALQSGKGFTIAGYVLNMNAIQGPGQIKALLCAALFPRSGDLVVCTDDELIYILQAGMFARRQAIPFAKIEALEFYGRSIYVSYRWMEPPKPPEEGDEPPAPEPHEVLREETLKVLCSSGDMMQLYEHIQRRWRASGAKAALDPE